MAGDLTTSVVYWERENRKQPGSRADESAGQAARLHGSAGARNPSEVDADAPTNTSCPVRQCGQERLVLRRVLPWAVGVVIGRLAVGLVMAGFCMPRPPPTVAPLTPVTVGDRELRVREARRLDFIRCERFEPPPQDCIGVLVEVTNRGSSMAAYHYEDFWLEGPTGDCYRGFLWQRAAGREVIRGQLGRGSLAPGSGVSGYVWFHTPLGNSDSTLVYQPGNRPTPLA